jgi:phage gpG-like protein
MNITITGLDKVMKNLSPAQMEAPKRRFLKRVALIVEGAAKKRAPVKHGHLRRSITHRPERDRAFVGTNIKYGRWIELGTKPGNYVTKTGKPAFYRGIKPRLFLEGGLMDSQTRLRNESNKFGNELASKLGG